MDIDSDSPEGKFLSIRTEKNLQVLNEALEAGTLSTRDMARIILSGEKQDSLDYKNAVAILSGILTTRGIKITYLPRRSKIHDHRQGTKKNVVPPKTKKRAVGYTDQEKVDQKIGLLKGFVKLLLEIQNEVITEAHKKAFLIHYNLCNEKVASTNTLEDLEEYFGFPKRSLFFREESLWKQLKEKGSEILNKQSLAKHLQVLDGFKKAVGMTEEIDFMQ